MSPSDSPRARNSSQAGSGAAVPDVPRPSWTRRPARRCTPMNSRAPPTWTPPSRPPQRALPEWGGATPGERSDALHRFAAALAEDAGRSRPAESLQLRKADQAQQGVRRTGLDRQRRVLRRRRPPPGGQGGRASTAPTTPPSSAASRIGVVGSIAPWNYPLQMAAWKVLPAIAAGNTIVLKPAEITPLTSLMFAQAAQRAGLPDGVHQHRLRGGPGRRRAPGRPPGPSP